MKFVMPKAPSIVLPATFLWAGDGLSSSLENEPFRRTPCTRPQTTEGTEIECVLDIVCANGDEYKEIVLTCSYEVFSDLEHIDVRYKCDQSSSGYCAESGGIAGPAEVWGDL